jgi:hypothetical protein
LETGKDLIKDGIQKVLPNLGVGAAAGKAAAEAIKVTAGMPLVPRMAIVGSAALVTAAGTKIGIELASAAVENISKVNEITESKSDNKELEGRNSP